MEFSHDILDLTAPAVFFPVRHHSPMSAKLVQQLIERIQPAAVLVEGPSDFNAQIDQLTLPHQLPIAIYSYAHLSNGQRRGAFYPYCIYSPEWQAIQTAHVLDIPVRFIDIPWAEIAATARSSHRYAETELRQSSYIRQLGQTLGTEGLDNLWDRLFEIDPNLSLEDYLERCHRFCFHGRVLGDSESAVNQQRERFMLREIRWAMNEFAGTVLVVTGGFHSYALFAQIFGQPFPQPQETPETILSEVLPREGMNGLETISDNVQATDQGAALTPFSYQRLDILSGYDAGMPSPGFYHQVWCDRTQSPSKSQSAPPYQQILTQVVTTLRQRKQLISAADLIAVQTMAQSLADLRGHEEIWRQDIVDAIIAALIKEPIQPQTPHPFLKVVQEVFCGQQRGQLARGTSLPPLARHIQAILQEFELTPRPQAVARSLNLSVPQQRQCAHILHQLHTLQITGFDLLQSCGWQPDTETFRLAEEWVIRWQPEFEASCIENSIYGCTLAEASAACLRDLASRGPATAEKATQLLLQSCLMGLPQLSQHFQQRLHQIVQADNSFFSVSGALTPLLFLYRYDTVLTVSFQEQTGALLKQVLQRSLWLLNNLGATKGNGQQLLRGIKAILHTFERCTQSLALDTAPLIKTCKDINADPQQSPLWRGAALGVLWRMDAAASEQVLHGLVGASRSEQLGDFLTGLFYLARETMRQNSEMLTAIDQAIASFDHDTFLEALPALHLAFTYFSPREKHDISHRLLQTWALEQSSDGQGPSPDRSATETTIEITPEMIAQAQAIEANALETIRRYGLRGGSEA
ncbi:MAG: hypothetical protein F6K00_35155 [Leptolyngbya sp. SIOISBB]|nr:hypothetical protein [Leptolyngbya sp. SIOISBB]